MNILITVLFVLDIIIVLKINLNKRDFKAHLLLEFNMYILYTINRRNDIK